MSGTPSLTILSEEQKFNGDNLLQWTTNMTQLLGSKGLLGYIDGKIVKPAQPATGGTTTPDPTPIYSTSPNFDEWTFRDQLARGHIILNCMDVASLGVVTTGTAKDAWDSVKREWGKSTDMHRSHAQELLDKTVYAEGTDIQEHVKLLRTRRAAVDNLSGSAMTDETWKGIIIRSIPPTTKWLLVIPSLYAITSPADIFSMLLAHGMILERGNQTKPTSGSSNTVLAVRTNDACTNPNCKAKKRSTHNTANCYWPGGGKEGQFPPNFGQQTRGNATTTHTPNTSEHFVLSARIVGNPGNSGVFIHEDDTSPFILSMNIPRTSGNSGVIIHEDYDPTMALVSKSFRGTTGGLIPTFMDSGVSDTMFVSKEAFTEYTATPPRSGDTAKAVDGGFEIIGEGKVTQTYLVDGQAKSITFTRALHTPTLNANLISISSFDRAGLITTFGNGRGVIRKSDDTVVLAGRGDKGMYIVETCVSSSNQSIPNHPLAMGSLSNTSSLEQLHRRLSHCSPATIQEMVKGELVDGLKVSEVSTQGKCEDCILGRQTRRPFDGETEKVLDPLELVAFDLWGPSRTQSGGGKIYFMPVVDAGTSYKHGAYLSDKSDISTIAAFDAFRAKAEALTGRKIRRLHTDRTYESAAWEEYCKHHGIVHKFTAPYSSAQNGLAERAIRTTMDDVRTLLHDSGLPHSYWAEAAAFSVDTRNLIPSRRHPGRIPLESFSGKRQDISHLRVFGVKCWAKIPTVNGVLISGGSKLDHRGIECRFLGYATGHGNYKVQDVASKRVFVSRDVIFKEGLPHRTSLSVGENIPLFDAVLDAPLGDNSDLTNQPIHHDDPDQQQKRVDNHADNHADRSIPGVVEPRKSTRVSQPSNLSLQSKEYQQREQLGRSEGQDWATGREHSYASFAFDRLSFEQDDYIACLTETKALHHIPHSYHHAMATDPD